MAPKEEQYDLYCGDLNKSVSPLILWVPVNDVLEDQCYLKCDYDWVFII